MLRAIIIGTNSGGLRAPRTIIDYNSTEELIVGPTTGPKEDPKD